MPSLFTSDEVPAQYRSLVDGIIETLAALESIDEFTRVAAINEIKTALHRISPMKNEPVDCVLWVPADSVTGNDYNPNSVAPPEMRLLEKSIESDGYTQPIVTMLKEDFEREVIDGFHRHIVGTHFESVSRRILGYLPVVTINKDRTDRSDRIAATIRHNRARGKHRVEGMSDIVVELKRRNWTDDKIGRELGMEPDEVLRLSQISGLAEMFSDAEFTQSWDIDALTEEPTEADLEELE